MTGSDSVKLEPASEPPAVNNDHQEVSLQQVSPIGSPDAGSPTANAMDQAEEVQVSSLNRHKRRDTLL